MAIGQAIFTVILKGTSSSAIGRATRRFDPVLLSLDHSDAATSRG